MTSNYNSEMRLYVMTTNSNLEVVRYLVYALAVNIFAQLVKN